MVVDSLSNKSLYEPMNRYFSQAFEFLQNCKKQIPATGRYEINGEALYAVVQEYYTCPEEKLVWEAHRRYIDIQYVLMGSEAIEWAELKKTIQCGSYNKEKDCILSGEELPFRSSIRLEEGQFAIFYPKDLHKPKCQIDVPAPVKKIVVKVLI